MTIAFLNLLARCIFRIQCVWVYFGCEKRLFYLSTDPSINVLNTRLRVRCATFLLWNKQNHFSWSVAKGLKFSKRLKNQLKIILEMSHVLEGIVQDIFVSISIHGKRMMKGVSSFCNAKRAFTFSTIFLKTKNQTRCCLVVMAHIALSKIWVVTTKVKNHLVFWLNFSANQNERHSNLCQRKQKFFHFFHYWLHCDDFPLVDTVNQKFFSSLISYIFSLQ